ncbi:MAG TPA: peptide-methionine (S)-S-oxide reductase MsrA [Sphingomonas sp.]|jgi:peptide-methionine (S)-S-oxide reductase|uniref:peptide-methionine (S)-S-oxide reductase MsrA n=1 Tax=Sphingomonas sp. TaxID=28214 RepID=UPI002ED979B8
MSVRVSVTAAIAAGLIAVGTLSTISAASAEVAVRTPAARVDPAGPAGMQTAVFAGGCFWGVQGVYQRVKGVQSAVSGYAGGAKATAQYERVSGGDTGHAEAVRITYDPRVVSYGTLLQIYFSVVADPTQLNAQGPDRGTQYRSAIMPTTPAQAQVARAYIAQLGRSGVWKRPIVTRIEPYRGFYPAEPYHQDYLVRNPDSAYIRINDLPKVKALQSFYPAMTRPQPVLVGS